MNKEEYRNKILEVLKNKGFNPADLIRNYMAERAAIMILQDWDYETLMELLKGEITPYYSKDSSFDELYEILIEELDPDDIENEIEEE